MSGTLPILCPKAGGSVCIKDSSRHWQVFFTQVLTTFIFISTVVICKGATTNPAKSDAVGALTCALALLAVIEVDRFYGPCFNPTIGICQTLYQVI